MHTPLSRRVRLAAISSTALLVLAGCSSEDEDESAGDGEPGGSSSQSPGSTPAPTSPRVAVSYEGGIVVLDGATMEVVADVDSEEFTRLNPAGDDRHVMVTVADGFQLLDTGAGTESGEAELTDVVFEADTPGHVVTHAGRTVLYADGTSDTTVIDTASLATASEEAPETTTVPGVEAHHGVSIVLEDGTLLTTVGDAESRSGAVAQDEDGTVIAENDQCPGIHGEGTAADEAVVFGCDDGALLYVDGAFQKLAAPDQPYGRMGNAYVSETSPLVVGDYKTDPDAEGYLLDEVAVIDTAAATHEVVELPEGVEYTFRDVARGPDDLAYILATDGAIHVMDPETRELTDAFPVVDAWEGPAEWQDPHPAIKVAGTVAYVTDPADSEVHAVDLTTGEVLATATLDVAPNEIAVAG
ncbi:zinc metallochaperone AztD [Nocardioides dongxiaopingii]|uniref:zinc metallochaperone AztD n=1 Tax=Nocardioides sp. S-1144 TaxID=2582905 RepID=UPI0016524C05|nr:zinc metallochaperone AztD [Nocardioides sp. S-1144]